MSARMENHEWLHCLHTVSVWKSVSVREGQRPIVGVVSIAPLLKTIWASLRSVLKAFHQAEKLSFYSSANNLTHE
jgi:hypothetical protein